MHAGWLARIQVLRRRAHAALPPGPRGPSWVPSTPGSKLSSSALQRAGQRLHSTTGRRLLRAACCLLRAGQQRLGPARRGPQRLGSGPAASLPRPQRHLAHGSGGGLLRLWHPPRRSGPPLLGKWHWVLHGPGPCMLRRACPVHPLAGSSHTSWPNAPVGCSQSCCSCWPGPRMAAPNISQGLGPVLPGVQQH